MKTQNLNLFIVDDNLLMLTDLRIYLENRFGRDLNIFTFLTGIQALEKVDKDTSIVILDYFLEKENGNEVLKSIKVKNPKTKVIMLSSNEEIGVAIESFRKGASDYIIKGGNSWAKLTTSINQIITYPYRIMVKELGVNKFLAAFLLTFVVLGAVVFTTLHFMK